MASVTYPYRNLRGVCYLPTYNTLNTSPPFTGWTGVSGFDRFWQYYSASLTAGSTGEEVYNQLERIKKAGFNTIRVWMAFNPSKSPFDNYAYVGDEATYATKYAHFIAVAAAHGLRVIPVIFDSYTASPSEAYMTSCNGSSYQDWKSSAAKTFIDVMTTGELQYPGTILMWDLFNEPWYGDWADSTVVKTFLLYAARYLKEQKFLDYFTVPNLVSGNGWKKETDQIETANSDYVDVLSVHPYALTKHYLATQLKTLRNDVCADKPVVITETGAPGYGYNYVEALDYCAKYRLGYCLYQAMIGWSDATSQFLHLYESGIFYHNGKVRETEVVKRVRSDARADGVAEGDLYSEAEIDALLVDSEDPEYVPQAYVARGDDGMAFIYDLFQKYPDDFTGNLTDQERLSLGTSLYYYTLADIIAGTTYPYHPYAGLDKTDILAAYVDYVANWGSKSNAEKEALLNSWRDAAKPFLGFDATNKVKANPGRKIRRGF